MSRLSCAALVLASALALSGCPGEAAKPQKATPNPAAGGVGGFLGSANKVKLKASIMVVLNAAQAHKATTGEAPEDVQVLVEAGDLTADQAKDLWGFDYEIVDDGPSLSVVTYGADNAEGGEGANKDWSSDDLK
jgi:hypothetical protein